MNGVDSPKEIILVTKKIFTGREESKDFARGNVSVMNKPENLHEKKRKEKKRVNS
jgi:hypothetical protein